MSYFFKNFVASFFPAHSPATKKQTMIVENPILNPILSPKPLRPVPHTLEILNPIDFINEIIADDEKVFRAMREWTLQQMGMDIWNSTLETDWEESRWKLMMKINYDSAKKDEKGNKICPFKFKSDDLTFS